MKKKVLILSNMYPSRHSKTFGIFVKNQAELLKAKGLDVDVIAISDPRKGKRRVITKYLTFFIKGFLAILLKGRSYDAVHVHYLFPTGLLGLVYKFMYPRKKLIVTSHGGDIDQMIHKGGLPRSLTEKIVKKADEVIAVGVRLKEEVIKQFHVPEEKVHVLSMGINRDVFHVMSQEEARNKLDLPQAERMIFFVGNLIEAKGLTELGQAFRQLNGKMENLSLHMMGEPKNKAYYEWFQEEFKDLPNIHIHPAQDQPKLALWMAAADVFVLPSHIEGFGLVALEAMACGTPVVGTDVGGLTYLLDDQAGLKVHPKDANDLAEKLDSLLQDKQLQQELVQHSQKKVEANDQETLIERIISFYG
ncbi:glycosyltransferase [Radiobacillus deserti]|uniref:glycosyltransferase n=1 Tax=Radiobacillus deserti TaxID=2594883 RepID=UPI0013154CAE|nr:glycosyltransferase [Radiobacillus deserti]